uniref:Uncharacterized protein n=1 Tax=Panagrolaimus davidi TaxID=227884 RepID=A0A914PS03_9BILA
MDNFINNFRVLLFLSCIVGSHASTEIFEVNKKVFIKHDEQIVTVFQKDHIRSKIFSLNAKSFHIPPPEAIKNLTVSSIKAEVVQYANQLTAEYNFRIEERFKQTCSYHTERSKRFIPIPFGIIAIAGATLLFYGIVMSVRNEIILDGLQRQLTEAQEQLNTVSTALYNLTNTFAEYQYVTKFKFDFNAYARTFEKTNYEFLNLLHSKKALRIDEIPETISRYFEDVTADDPQKKFYYLKLLSCEEQQIIVELTVADSIPSHTLHCHSYSDVGSFDDNVYTKFILPGLYCYHNDTCSTVDRNQCLKAEGHLQCTESAFFQCNCEINNIQQCQAKAQLAPPNFVHIDKTGNILTIATTATFYEIIKYNGNKIVRLVPESKIFSVTLNAEDRLKIGGIIVDGESEEPTFIARLFPDTFTMDPVPTTPPIPIEKKTKNSCQLFH